MIDSSQVYSTVLTILNKEQRGYLDATEFNNLADQVQREIYESYFGRYLAAPDQGPLVANPQMIIDDKVSNFEVIADIDERNEDSFFEYPDGNPNPTLYRLGLVTNRDNNVEIQRVDHKMVTYMNLSPLTAPSEKQPVYVIHTDGIQVYPREDSNAVTKITMVYLKEPTRLSDINGNDGAIITEIDADTNEITYRTNKSFDLDISEFQEVVVKICAYAGVVVRAPEVTAFSQGVESKLDQTQQ